MDTNENPEKIEKATEAKAPKAKATEAKAEKPARSWDDLVPFYAFKDNDKYKNDIFVSVGDKTFRIKRGVNVMIPRNVAKVLKRSMDQDAVTASLIDQQSEAYAAEARQRNL